ncbi:MAG: ATP-NAD kinase [Thermoplasmata archaeon]|nr:MAG: ATP-NAD kinase [Thermoplasmata archaeon]
MRIGFVVNPYAGMGGKIGLKGTDDIEEALRRGGEFVAPGRAREFCRDLDADILTCSSSMGGDYTEGKIVYEPMGRTTADDTRRACRKFLAEGVDAIVFVGGDGTARDIYEVVGMSVPILGIPAGVKMYSGVFAVNPPAGREIVRGFMRGDAEVVEREIMDASERAYINDEFVLRFFGSARSLSLKHLLQNAKRIFGSENDAKREIASFLSLICRRGTFVLGPGGTLKEVGKQMGVDKTLLGVDVIENGVLVAKDANEREILDAISGKHARILVSPLGSQGCVFGRGNQQISSNVIKKVGVENIIIVSTPHKLMHTPVLFVDTGDNELNRDIAGVKQVIVGFGLAARKEIIS